jgi:hypothetical protein
MIQINRFVSIYKSTMYMLHTVYIIRTCLYTRIHTILCICFVGCTTRVRHYTTERYVPRLCTFTDHGWYTTTVKQKTGKWNKPHAYYAEYLIIVFFVVCCGTPYNVHDGKIYYLPGWYVHGALYCLPRR